MGHVLTDLYLAQGVPVAPVGSVKFLHQVHQRSELQGLEHKVLSPAHTQRAEAPPTVNSQHDVVEVVPWELRLKAEGEALNTWHVVGEVTAPKVKEMQLKPRKTYNWISFSFITCL